MTANDTPILVLKVHILGIASVVRTRNGKDENFVFQIVDHHDVQMAVSAVVIKVITRTEKDARVHGVVLHEVRTRTRRLN